MPASLFNEYVINILKLCSGSLVFQLGVFPNATWGCPELNLELARCVFHQGALALPHASFLEVSFCLSLTLPDREAHEAHFVMAFLTCQLEWAPIFCLPVFWTSHLFQPGWWFVKNCVVLQIYFFNASSLWIAFWNLRCKSQNRYSMCLNKIRGEQVAKLQFLPDCTALMQSVSTQGLRERPLACPLWIPVRKPSMRVT